MECEQEVAARLQAESLEDPRAPQGDRGEPEARVGHHVPHDFGVSGHALGSEGLARSLVRAEQ